MATTFPERPVRLKCPRLSVTVRWVPPGTMTVADCTGRPPVPTTTPATLPDWAKVIAGVMAIVVRASAIAVIAPALVRAPRYSAGEFGFLMVTPMEFVGRAGTCRIAAPRPNRPGG